MNLYLADWTDHLGNSAVYLTAVVGDKAMIFPGKLGEEPLPKWLSDEIIEEHNKQHGIQVVREPVMFSENAGDNGDGSLQVGDNVLEKAKERDVTPPVEVV